MPSRATPESHRIGRSGRTLRRRQKSGPHSLMYRWHQRHSILQSLQLSLLIDGQRVGSLSAEGIMGFRHTALKGLDIHQQLAGRRSVGAAFLQQAIQIGLALPNCLHRGTVRLTLLLLDLLQALNL